MPRLEISIGTVLTPKNKEMLSRTPNIPHPKLLISLGSSSPKVVINYRIRKQFFILPCKMKTMGAYPHPNPVYISTTDTKGRKLMESLIETSKDGAIQL